MSISVPTSIRQDFQDWRPQRGDIFYVDTQVNRGFLIHESGDFTSFPLATGQRRFVSYIGLYYNAATPVGTWTVKSIHTQGDRVTYGKRGTFLRLYRDGEEWSHYGIHEHLYGNEMLASDQRYRSMGCIIVSREILDTLMATYELNGEELQVVTSYGLDDTLFAARDQEEEEHDVVASSV
ncbi:hypothetical protein COW95_00030 [Candidatus Peregrinibacteria bacterium CG22_combo_CG10-13_8_21_14_all_49_11]|nr:MAG: hypothetical protein COW95_00030 [Candidatus Peregrinibacteria bacterium CG22_combo_CG10-13_8_21_14_all_49_11]